MGKSLFVDSAIGFIGVVGSVCLLVYTGYEMRVPETVIKRVQVCSPRSVDQYSPTELRRMAGARERMERVK